MITKNKIFYFPFILMITIMHRNNFGAAHDTITKSLYLTLNIFAHENTNKYI